MSELLLCAACLNNEVNLINIDTSQLRDPFNVICGVQTQHVPGVSQYLCVMCVAYLRKMMKLKEQCLTSSQHFQEIFHKCQEENRECKNEDLKPINNALMLSFSKFDKFKYSEIYENDPKNKKCKVIYLSEKIPTLHYELNNRKDSFDTIYDNDTDPSVVMPENIQDNDTDPSVIMPENIHDIDTAPSFIMPENIHDNDTDPSVIMPENIHDNDTAPSVVMPENIQVKISSLYNQSHYVTVLNENIDMFDTDKSNLSFIDENDNNDDTEVNSHNSQEVENKFTDSPLLPRGISKKRLKLIEYYAYIEFLPENEARAANELQIKIDARNPKTKRSRCRLCNICDQMVYSYQYNSHRRAHKEIGPNHCSICFVNLKGENGIKQHNVQYHMFKYICRICSEVTFTILNAEVHYKEKHNSVDLAYRLQVDEENVMKESVDPLLKVFTKTPVLLEEEKREIFKQRQFQQNYIDAKFKCGICFTAMKTEELLHKHVLVHAKNGRNATERPHKCLLCLMYFVQEYNLIQHNIREHDYKYTCNECGDVVCNRMSALKHRSEKHHARKCSYCNIEFESKFKLEKHLPTHYSNFCNVCGRIFGSKHSINVHVAVQHQQSYNLYIKTKYDPDRSSQFYCGECQVQFHNAVAYNRHLTLKEHKEATAVECDTEDNQNGVESEEAVKPVMRITMNCHLCGVFLSNGKIARNHYKEFHTLAEYYKQIHTTTYKCEQCNYTTKNPLHYKRHARKHKMDFTIPCQICGKRFNSVARLWAHQIVHSDETPYECDYCNKKFKSRERIILHIRTVHLKIPYMPWIRRTERRKRERALERQKRAEESQGKDKNECKYETLTEGEESQQDMDVIMMDAEQYIATEYLNNIARSGNVMFVEYS